MQRVLIVEDSAAMRGLIASVIAEIPDCEVVEVEGAFQALKELPGGQYALIVTDINMPDINGFELLSFIRKNPAYHATPVLIVSSDESERQRDKSITLGASAYLHKPFEPEALRATVEELLSR